MEEMTVSVAEACLEEEVVPDGEGTLPHNSSYDEVSPFGKLIRFARCMDAIVGADRLRNWNF